MAESTATNLMFLKLEGRPNELLRIDDDHYVSFNARSNDGSFGMFQIFIGAHEDGIETAIIQENEKPRCRVLTGDHREAFVTAANTGGWPACVALYEKLAPDHRSEWSED